MPELGRYALAVALAYGGSFAALALLIGVSVARWRALRARLDAAEREHG